jgi:hypothetical protein
MSSDQLKGVHGTGPYPAGTAKYSSGPRPELLPPRKDPLGGRENEDQHKGFIQPTVGKIRRQDDEEKAIPPRR